MNQLLSWLSFLVNITVVVVFVVSAVLSAKRIGGASPWLLATVGAIDGLLIVVFRLYRVVATPRWDDPIFEALRLLDVVSMYGCGLLALVALYLLYPKPRV